MVKLCPWLPPHRIFAKETRTILSFLNVWTKTDLQDGSVSPHPYPSEEGSTYWLGNESPKPSQALPAPQTCTNEVAPIPINHSSCSSPTCSHRTSSPHRKYPPSISRMPARETCKSPQAFWQPASHNTICHSFPPEPAPPSVLRKGPSAPSADGAPHENANAHLLPQPPGEPTHLGKRGSCLGSHTLEGPYTTSTHKRNGLKITWAPLLLASRCPVALTVLAPPCSSLGLRELLLHIKCLISVPIQKWLEFEDPEALWVVTLQSMESDTNTAEMWAALMLRYKKKPSPFLQMAPTQLSLVSQSTAVPSTPLLAALSALKRGPRIISEWVLCLEHRKWYLRGI